jgi:hypothetical protein
MKLKTVLIFTGGASAPLIISLAPHDLIALAAGGALVLTLAHMTHVDSGHSPSSNAKEVEAKAIENVVMTSTSNRTVRVALGSVYAYGAVKFALRWAGAGVLDRVLQKDVAAVGQVAAAWLVCLADGYFTGIWMSTGANGE